MTVLGFWITMLAFVTALAASFNYYRNATRQRFLLYPARFWLKLSAASIVVASVLLLALLLRHDFSNGYVFSYSDKALPLHFLISSFYAGQEGSFLFWALCASLIALWLSRFTAKRGSEPFVMGVFMSVQSFLLLLLLVKSPFRSVWEMFPTFPADQVPADGRGLNPLLQNFWMVVHPPVLFIGFAAMAVPFSFSVAGLWKKDFSAWVGQAFPWVLFATLALGMGLMLGAYWAYGVLGWGGYWGWDPVENSSLVPWLTGVALLHTMIAQKRSQRFVRTNVVLAILSFFLVVYSTFLTRSGILGDSSVHSFVDPGATVYWLLVAFLVFIAALGFGLMYVRRKDLLPNETASAFVSRETALGAGTIVLLLSAAVILFGTSLPIFSKSGVDPSFYDTTNLPIAIALGVLIGLSLFVQWGSDEGKDVLQRSRNSFAAAFLLTALLWFAGASDWMTVALIFSSAFAFFVNLEISLRTIKGNFRLLGGKLAHIGLAIMFLGIVATGRYSSTKHLSLPLNTPQQALGYTLTYTGYHPTEDGKFAFHVRAEKDGREFHLDPIMFEAGQQGLMRNPDIVSFFTKDFYVSPVSLDQPAATAEEMYTIPKGETVSLGNVRATFVKFDMNAHATDAMVNGSGGMTIGSVLELSNGSAHETVIPVARYSSTGQPAYDSTPSKLINGRIQLVAMNVGMGGEEKSTVTVRVERTNGPAPGPETLVVEASIKPYINLLWAGTLVMMVGFLLAISKRRKEA